MKRLFVILIIAFSAVSMSAQSFGPSVTGNNFNTRSRSQNDGFLPRGYRGMIEASYGVCFGTPYCEEVIFISTTQGWQFNPHLYMGVMAGISECKAATFTCFALDSRYYLSKKRFAPYLNAKLGIRSGWKSEVLSTLGYNATYYGVGFGFRLALFRKAALSFSLNYGPGCIHSDEGSVTAKVGIEF